MKAYGSGPEEEVVIASIEALGEHFPGFNRQVVIEQFDSQREEVVWIHTAHETPTSRRNLTGRRQRLAQTLREVREPTDESSAQPNQGHLESRQPSRKHVGRDRDQA
jgi:hypothetical protein